MGKVTFNKIPAFGDKGKLELSKAFQYNTAWEPIPFHQFLKLTVEDFMRTDFRAIVEFKLNEQIFRLATHEEDYRAIHEKHPNDVVVHIKQVLKLWKHVDDVEEKLPRVLLTAGFFKAKVV